MTTTPMIELKNVHKKFGDKIVLNGLDLVVPRGSSLVVIGGSGTGKSVMLKCILGLIKPDHGSIKIDGKEVANYLYTDRELDALIRGGVHCLHMANLKTGDHELVAIFIGHGPHQREYRRGAILNFDKTIGAKYIELEITDRVKPQQPEFIIKEWE